MSVSLSYYFIIYVECCVTLQACAAAAPAFALTPSFQFGQQSSKPVYQFKYDSFSIY